MTFFLRHLVTLLYWLGGVDFLGDIMTLKSNINTSHLIMSLSYLVNWMAGTLFLFVITVTNIMARLLVTCGALFSVNCLVKRFMNEVAFNILDC